ncbi:MAG TPA: DUF2759 domain-containing protein [Savagea sp.]
MNILVAIFGLVAIFSVFGTFDALKQRNYLGVVFNVASLVVFGGFSILTIVFQGYPATLN